MPRVNEVALEMLHDEQEKLDGCPGEQLLPVVHVKVREIHDDWLCLFEHCAGFCVEAQ